MSVKLLTEHYLEFLSIKGCCSGSSESTLVKMPHCWKSHSAAHFFFFSIVYFFLKDLFLLIRHAPNVSYKPYISRSGQEA